MKRSAALPDNSPPVQAAAGEYDAPAAVLVTVTRGENGATAEWEVRCFGESDSWRAFAGAMADVLVEALNNSEPPARAWQLLRALQAKPTGRTN